MATQQEIANQLTMVEIAKRQAGGKVLDTAMVLSAINQGFEDAAFLEANDVHAHTFNQSLALPSGTWRQLNDGAATEAMLTKQIAEPIRYLESYSRVDLALLDGVSDPDEVRWNEDQGFLEGLAQTFWTGFFYGNPSTDLGHPEGLANRGDYDAAADANVLDTGGSGSDTTSIWLIQWGPRAVHFVYPKGSRTVGIEIEDRGQQTVAGATSGTYFEAMVTHFKINVGIVIRDPRYVQRVCSVEASGSSNIFAPADLVDAKNKLPNPSNLMGTVIYCNRAIKSQIDKDALAKSNVYYTVNEIYGRPVTHFQGIPVKLMEEIVSTETAL